MEARGNPAWADEPASFCPSPKPHRNTLGNMTVTVCGWISKLGMSRKLFYSSARCSYHGFALPVSSLHDWTSAKITRCTSKNGNNLLQTRWSSNLSLVVLYLKLQGKFSSTLIETLKLININNTQQNVRQSAPSAKTTSTSYERSVEVHVTKLLNSAN